jgi:nitrile hydratase accessory protein
MVGSTDKRIALMDGDVALPRKNGELVFQAPWEGRVFGLAVALSDCQLYPWDEFRAQLIQKIASAEAQGDPSTYYERWLAAFESLLLARGVITQEELDARTVAYESGERDVE